MNNNYSFEHKKPEQQVILILKPRKRKFFTEQRLKSQKKSTLSPT